MKRLLICILAISLLAGTASMVLADNQDPSLKIRDLGQRMGMMWGNKENMPKLEMTEEHQTRMQSILKQCTELRKEILRYNVDQGVITDDQLQQFSERMDKMAELHASGQLKAGARFKENLTEEQLAQLEERKAKLSELKESGELPVKIKRSSFSKK